jgi:hypothetical protein
MSMLFSLLLILVHAQGINNIHHLFWILGFQTIEYFEFISLVKGPFIAKFNQHDSSYFGMGLSPTNVPLS